MLFLFEGQTSNEISSFCIREHEESKLTDLRARGLRESGRGAPEGLGLFFSGFGFPSSHWVDELLPLVCSGTMSSYTGKTEEASKGSFRPCHRATA